MSSPRAPRIGLKPGSTTPPTISDMASDPMTSIRSNAATTAPSGEPAGEIIERT
jgi:hypothetical protein